MGTPRLARIMPNTPSLINEGFSVWYQKDSKDKILGDFCKETFSNIGKEM